MHNRTSLYKKTKEFLKRNSKRFTEWLQIFRLEPSTRKGIVITLFITVPMGLGFAGYKHLQTGWGYPVDVLLGMLTGLIALGLGYALFRLSLLLLAKLTTKFAAFVLAVFFTLLFLLWGDPETGFLLIAGIVLAAATLGGTLTIATSPKFKTVRMARKIGLGSGFGFSLLAFIALFWWLAQTGSAEELVKIEGTSADSIAQLKAPNPSLRVGCAKGINLYIQKKHDIRINIVKTNSLMVSKKEEKLALELKILRDKLKKEKQKVRDVTTSRNKHKSKSKELFEELKQEKKKVISYI